MALNSYKIIQQYVGARGIKPSRCRSTEHLCEVARVLFGVPDRSVQQIAGRLCGMGRKGRARAASQNLDKAKATFRDRTATSAVSDGVVTEDGDDGSQDALDCFAVQEWSRFLTGVKKGYWSIPRENLEARQAYAAFVHQRFNIRV